VLVELVDLRLDRPRLVLEVVAQTLADDSELGRQLGCTNEGRPASLELMVVSVWC
jgi:hypothetical protein